MLGTIFKERKLFLLKLLIFKFTYERSRITITFCAFLPPANSLTVAPTNENVFNIVGIDMTTKLPPYYFPAIISL